jgi:hypothetical protein
MNTIRALLGIVGGLSAGYAICALLPFTGLSVTDFGVAAAISAACVLGIYLVRAIQADQTRDREQMRLGREAVWARRDACSWPLCSFEPHECPEGSRTA